MKTIWQRFTAFWEYCGSQPEALAQLAHIGWGAALLFAIVTAWHGHLLWGVVLAVVLAVGKEVSEYWTETGETRGSTLEDVVFWSVGIGIAVLWLLAFHF